MRTLLRTIAGAAAIAVIAAASAQAAPLQMHSSGFGQNGGVNGEGGGRGIGFLVNSTFTIDTVSIFGNLVEESFDAEIFASTNGSDAGALLASASAVVGGAGAVYNDIALDFTFDAGSFYVLSWSPTDGGFGDWLAALTPNFYFSDSDLPETTGPVTLLDGAVRSGSEFNFGNSLHPNLRVNIVEDVSEPSAIALIGLGLAGLGFAARRRRRTAR